MNLTSKLLHAKHWQLFLLTGVPLFIQPFASKLIHPAFYNPAISPPAKILSVSLFAVMIISFGIFLGWLWAVGTGLQKKMPGKIEMATNQFKVILLIAAVLLLYRNAGIAKMLLDSEPPTIPQGVPIVNTVVDLIMVLCILYCFYFVSMTFKTAELQRETTFSDFGKEFMLIWIYPVGIWIIQPKINKLVKPPVRK